MAKHLLRRNALIAAVAASLATAAVPAADAHIAAARVCGLLPARQVASIHVATACKQLAGRPNPYFTSSTAIWGTPGDGSVVLAVNHAKDHAYIGVWESQHTRGPSIRVGSWSRANCASSGAYCYLDFVVGDDVIVLQVAPPAGKPLPSSAPAIAMAKTIAGRLA
jgi:hypothetical protein